MFCSSSDEPPPLGVQSSHPTFPGLPLQSGTITRVFIGQSVGVTIASPLDAHVTTVTGTVTGRTMQPVSKVHPCRSPLTAVAVVVALKFVRPITRDTKVSNTLDAFTRTPATGPTTPLGQSGLVWLFVGSDPPPTCAASAGSAALV